MPSLNARVQALSPQRRKALQTLLQSFASSWDEHRLGALVRQLPPRKDPLRLPALIELVKLDLERQWQSGRHVKVEAYLKALPELGDAGSAPPDLIHCEYQARQQAGSPADLAQFSQRFPRQAAALKALVESAGDPPDRNRVVPAPPPRAATPPPLPKPLSLTRRTSGWMPLMVAVGLMVVAGGIVYFASTPRNGSPTPVNVTVQVQGLDKLVTDPTVVVFLLDGKPVTKEQLAQPINLEVGEHELVLKRQDGSVAQTRRFRVGADDKKVNPFEASETADAGTGSDDPSTRGRRRTSDPDPKPSAAAKPLIETLNDEDVTVRRQAAQSLEKLGDRSAVAALKKRVADDLWHSNDHHDGISSKKAALKALRSLVPDQVTGALVKATRSQTAEVGVWACAELAGQKGAEAAEGLNAALKSRFATIRAAAATALAAVRPPAVGALAGALSDTDVTVRHRAAASLVTLADRTRLPAATLRVVAEGATPALKKRVADDLWHSNDHYDGISSKKAALKALQALAADQVTEALLGALRSRDENVRVWACNELANLKDTESAAGLARALKDPSSNVRAAAARALSNRK
jgi:hypothetical protein